MWKGKITALLVLISMSFSSCVALRDSESSLNFPNYKKDGEISEETASTNAKNRNSHDLSHASSEDLTTDTPETSEKDSEADGLDKVEINDPYAGVSINFIAAGDNLIHPNIYTDAYYRGSEDKEYDFLPMYDDVADFIASADIAFINQETVMAGAEYGYSGYPCFNAPQQLGLDMVSLGFDIINIANNHMLDKGASGLESTINFWNSQPVMLIGGYLDEADAENIRVLEYDGVDIAFLSYTLSTNGIVKSASSDVVIPYIDDEQILSDMSKAREMCDILIVSIHWGDENTQTPNSEQYRRAQMIANAGADVILGHHSHTIQPIEWIQREDGGKTLCIYSLGNFVSGMARPVNQVGGLLSFTIQSDGEGGLEIVSPLFTPTLFYYGMDWYNTHLYFLEDYNDTLAASHGVQISGYYMTPADARSFVTGTIDSEFLPEWLQNAD